MIELIKPKLGCTRMKDILKKSIAILFTVIIIMNICACSSEESYNIVKSIPESDKTISNSQQKKITLKLWHIWTTDAESNKKPFERALQAWNDANPNVEIKAEATENETYKIKLRTAMAVNETPDIFYCWGAGFAKPFVNAGKVLPLDEYLNDGTKEKLIPGSLEYFTYDGRIYGLPIYMIAGVLYCNKQIFDNNGLKIPNTFNELLDAVKILNEKGITPMTVGEKDGWPGMFYQNILAIRTAGIKRCNNALNKKESFNQPEFVQSAEKLQELIKAGAFDKRSMRITRDEAESDLINGKVTMYYNGSWVAGTLDAEDSPVKGKIVVKNFPILEGASGDQNGFVGGAIDTFMISSETKYKGQAVKALKAINERFCKESYLAGAGIPAWKVDDVDKTKVSPLAKEILGLLKNSDGFVLAWDTYLQGTEAQKHIDLVAGLFSGEITPDEFARQMQMHNGT